MSGLLGKADLAADTSTDLYTVPTQTIATVNLNLCNRSADAVSVRIAVHIGTLTDADYLEYDSMIPPRGLLERTGLAMSAGETLTVRATGTGISARAHGFEENQ